MGCWWIGWNILCLLRNVDYVGWMLRDRFGGGVGGIGGNGMSFYYSRASHTISVGVVQVYDGCQMDPVTTRFVCICVFVELVVVKHWITRTEFNSFQLNSICACSTQSRLIKPIASTTQSSVPLLVIKWNHILCGTLNLIANVNIVLQILICQAIFRAGVKINVGFEKLSIQLMRLWNDIIFVVDFCLFACIRFGSIVFSAYGVTWARESCSNNNINKIIPKLHCSQA